MNDIDRDIHAVFLPAFGDLTLSSDVEAFLKNGCIAVLPGESREEYVSRKMTPEREATERAEHFSAFAEAAKAAAGSPVLIAVDQELAGIPRLHRLVPQLPDAATAARMSDGDLEAAIAETSKAARAMGVNMFLAPIVDVVTGTNVWLDNRTMGATPEVVGRIGTAFVRGAQSAGVVCTTKHFPGFHDITADPAVEADARVTASLRDIERGYAPFRQLIDAGTKAIMTGPALLEALDPEHSASTSPRIIRMLRQDFGFEGMIVSDDLDSPAVMRGQSVAQRAVDALNAGCDLLLVAAGPHLPDLALAVRNAVEQGLLPAERVSDAADRVRATCEWAR